MNHKLFHLIIILLWLATNIGYSQNYNDSLMSYNKKLLSEPDYIQLKQISSKIKSAVKSLANSNIAINYDSLNAISFLISKDKSLEIISWEIKNDVNSYDYFTIAITRSKGKSNYIEFTEKVYDAKSLEYAAVSVNKWYGAHYYQLIENIYAKKKSYTLIGIDWRGILSKKKIIDVVTIDNKGNLLFSDQAFSISGKPQRRFILEYKYDISVKCSYDENKKLIIFDHLVPPHPSLKNQKQFYVNDFSYDAFKFEKGKWMLIEDVDARNQKSEEDKNYKAPK